MKRREQGSVMIETALVLSLLLAMLIGMTDVAVHLLRYNFVSYAAREGTRYAEVHGATSPNPATPAAVEAYVRRFAMGARPADVHVKTEWTPDNQPGSKVRVEVDLPGMSSASEVIIQH